MYIVILITSEVILSIVLAMYIVLVLHNHRLFLKEHWWRRWREE